VCSPIRRTGAVNAVGGGRSWQRSDGSVARRLPPFATFHRQLSLPHLFHLPREQLPALLTFSPPGPSSTMPRGENSLATPCDAGNERHQRGWIVRYDTTYRRMAVRTHGLTACAMADAWRTTPYDARTGRFLPAHHNAAFSPARHLHRVTPRDARLAFCWRHFLNVLRWTWCG